MLNTTPNRTASVIADTFKNSGQRYLRALAAVPAALMLLAPLTAEAKTLYVNASCGNDATSYAANGNAYGAGALWSADCASWATDPFNALEAAHVPGFNVGHSWAATTAIVTWHTEADLGSKGATTEACAP